MWPDRLHRVIYLTVPCVQMSYNLQNRSSTFNSRLIQSDNFLLIAQKLNNFIARPMALYRFTTTRFLHHHFINLKQEEIPPLTVRHHVIFLWGNIASLTLHHHFAFIMKKISSCKASLLPQISRGKNRLYRFATSSKVNGRKISLYLFASDMSLYSINKSRME